jgi:Nif-specific regulatory protein
LTDSTPQRTDPSFKDIGDFTGESSLSPWGIKDGGWRIISLFLTIERLISEKSDMNGALDTLLYYLKKELGVSKAMICLFHIDSGKIFLNRSLGFTREEEESLNASIFQLEEKSRPKRPGSQDAQSILRNRGEISAHNSPFSTDANRGQTLVYTPIIRSGKVLGAFATLRLFGDSQERKDHETHLSFLATIFSSPASLYMFENIDKMSLEKKVRTLTSEIYELKERYSHTSLVSCSSAMQEVYFLLRKVASRKTIVLLLGEKGVEKETVAQSLHYDGLKAVGPFVKISCCDFNPELLEIELFGRESGLEEEESLKGLIEASDGGSIFIDEIESLPLGTQSKLLEFLKNGSFERVLGSETVAADVRVITGTSSDLKDLTDKGLFLEDLYYRVNVFPINIPPLKEREEDIVRLARHFLSRFSKEAGKNINSVSPMALEMLRAYDWPGNVLELENVIHRAVVMAEEKAVSIEPHDLPLNIKLASSKKNRESLSLEDRMADIEYEIITEALKRERGNVTKAAKDLGISRRSMALRMRRHNINYKDYRE